MSENIEELSVARLAIESLSRELSVRSTISEFRREAYLRCAEERDQLKVENEELRRAMEALQSRKHKPSKEGGPVIPLIAIASTQAQRIAELTAENARLRSAVGAGVAVAG